MSSNRKDTRLRQHFSTAYGRLILLEQGVLNLLLISMLLLVLAQVVSRYVSALPAFWIEEVARLTLVWITFLGAAVAVARGINLVVTFLSDRFGAAYTRAARIGSGILELVCFLTLALASWELLDQLGAVSTSASGLPRGLLFLAPLIGFTLAAIHTLVSIAKEILGDAKDETNLEELSV